MSCSAVYANVHCLLYERVGAVYANVHCLLYERVGVRCYSNLCLPPSPTYHAMLSFAILPSSHHAMSRHTCCNAAAILAHCVVLGYHFGG